MLEHSYLHVTCWIEATAGDANSAWLRRITDGAARPLGFVRCEGHARASWFSWLRGFRLDVFETEDSSLLMSLVRPWGIQRAWDVFDADDRRVGSVHPPNLLDSDGQKRGIVDLHDPGHGIIRDTKNIVLATFRKERGADLEVIFEPEPDANPFLRMLLLGGILALEPQPQG